MGIPVLPPTGGHVRMDDDKSEDVSCREVVFLAIAFLVCLVWLIVLPIMGMYWLMTMGAK